eukprot:SM000190S04870  [mRNA]  locus=s190:228597:233455:+ [translate_table: standard]
MRGRPPPAATAALLQLLAAALLVSWRPADAQVISSEGVWKIIDSNVTYSPVHVIVNRFDVLEFIFFHIPGFPKYPGSPNTVGNAEYTITGDVGATSKFTYCDSDFVCCGGTKLENGTIMTAGGNFAPGANRVQFLNPTPQACTAYHCGWSRIAMLIAGRWYPSVQRIADGRIFICGGNDIEQLPGVSDETGRASIPNYEYFPVHSGDTVHNLSLLNAPNKDTYYVSSYPLVHLINLGPSSSKLFILSNVSSVLLDTNTNTFINLPDMPYPSHSRNYPFSAASAVLPLSSTTGWLSEVLICGGTSNSAAALQNPGKPPKSGLVPASDNCGRISPALGALAKWEMEVMPSPRILGSLNILADGTLLLSCGVKAGRAHLTQQWMGDPNLFPVLYVPGHSAGSRMRELHANATIPRGRLNEVADRTPLAVAVLQELEQSEERAVKAEGEAEKCAEVEELRQKVDACLEAERRLDHCRGELAACKQELVREEDDDAHELQAASEQREAEARRQQAEAAADGTAVGGQGDDSAAGRGGARAEDDAEGAGGDMGGQDVEQRIAEDDSGCLASEEDIVQYFKYQRGGRCPDDWPLVQDLLFSYNCFALPRRRCISRAPHNYTSPLPLPQALWTLPANNNVRWHHHCLNTRRYGDCLECFDFAKEKNRWPREEGDLITIDKLLALKRGTIRIGIDIGAGTGSFAAKMAAHNVTIVSTGMNNRLPFMETIALRGLIPLNIPHAMRLPFFDNTLDIIHAMHSVKYVQLDVFEGMLYDWDRVVRPGGIIWLEYFYAPNDEIRLYIDKIRLLGYRELQWKTFPKPGRVEKNKPHTYLIAVLEKPLDRDYSLRQ